MNRFIFYIFFIFSLSLSHMAAANVSTVNVEGVRIIYFDDADLASTDINASTTQQVSSSVSQDILKHASTTQQVSSSVSQDILKQALSLKGIKYKYGGSSPATGFDCSGFVNYVFKKAANVTLPRTTRGLSRTGQKVSKQALQPGDLVFFNTRRRAYSHVGIYIGNGDFIHAPRSGRTVNVENIRTGYWKQRFNGAKRMDTSSQH